jgi:dolichol-phosphate mannosyltransferase
MAGFFSVRRELLFRYGQLSHGYKIGLEIMAQSDDTLRVMEVPITFTDREMGTSKLGSRVIVNYLTQIIRLAGGLSGNIDPRWLGAVSLSSIFVDIAAFNLLYSLGYRTDASQIASFALTAVAVYFLIVRGALQKIKPVSKEPGYFLSLRFLVISILALILRSGMISTLVSGPGTGERMAHLGGMAASAAVFFAGIVFFLFPRAGDSEKTGIRWRVLALAAAGYSLVLRILYAGVMDLLPEEAYYWNYGQHLDIGYLDHPPMVGWLIRFSTDLFGSLEMAVRLPAIGCWFITVFFMYRLTKNLFDKTAALITLLMLSVLPLYLGTGMFMMPDPPLYAAWAGALYFLSRALVDEHHRAWIGVGLCIGLGVISKYTILILAPAALTFVLLHIKKTTRKTLLRPELYAGAALSILLFLPVILWNAENEWVSFAFQGSRRWSRASSFSLHILVMNILIVLTPIGIAALSGVLYNRGKRLSGMMGNMDPDGLKFSFARVFTLFPLAVFLIHSFQGMSKLNWTGPVWFAAFPLLGAVISGSSRSGISLKTGFSYLAWNRTAAGCLLLYGALMFLIVTGMPGLGPFSGMPVPVAWKETSHAIDSIDVHRNAGEKRPLVIGLDDDYWIPSEYSFYIGSDSKFEPAGRHLVDKRAVMWAYWLPTEEAAGRDAVLISSKAERLNDTRLQSYFEQMEEVVELPVLKNGRLTGQFFYRFAGSYRLSP